MTETPTYTPEAAAALRGIAVSKLQVALRRAKASFEATPDEKLDYKPSETANSARQLIQHLVVGNTYVAGTFGLDLGVKEPASDRLELTEQLTQTTEAIIDGISNLTDDQINGSVDFFGHPMPMASFILVDEWHLTRHIGQLEYIQTIYGDMEDRL
jgi:hypothetical protein